MKLENLTKVLELSKQLKGIEKAVLEANIMVKEVAKGSGITISEFSDGSGSYNIEPLYVNGMHDKDTHNKIAEAIANILEAREDEILAEIAAIK